MRLTRRAILLFVTLLSTGAAALGGSIAPARTLAIAQSRPLLEEACGNLAISLGATPVRTAAGDASARALRAFVFSKRSVNVRAWCLRNARDIVRMGPKSAYVADLDAIQAATLTSARVDEQLAGARAAWADLDIRTGLLLCGLAQPGRPVDVRIAALKHLYWPMTFAGAGHDARVYARTVDRALHARDDRVVVAGLFAYAMLNQASADAKLLAYAGNPDPKLRLGAFEALSAREAIDGANSRLFAIGLRDPDIRVRSAALVALKLPTRADLRLLATFARNAPTPQDRRNADEQLSGFRGFTPFI